MLLTGADPHVDGLTRLGGGTRRHAHDDLAGVLTGAELGLGFLGADELTVDVGVGAQLLHEGQAHRDGVLVLGGDDVERLGAEPDGHLAAVLGGDGVQGRLGQLDLGGADGGDVPLDRELPQVHGRRADEAGDELVGGVVVHLARGADLLEHAVLEDRDAVTHGEGLGLVVGDVDRGDAQRALERGDLGAGLHTELGVQVGQRLVHEEDLGLTHDGAAHGHTLTLTTGEGLGLAVQVLGQTEDLGGLAHALVDLGLGGAGDLEGEAHVVVHGHVRVERVVLEDHGDVTVLGLNVGDVAVTDEDTTGVDVLQAREHAQGGGLTAAGGANEYEELAIGDLEVESVNTGAVIARVNTRGVLESNSCHGWCFPSPAGTCRTIRRERCRCVSALTRAAISRSTADGLILTQVSHFDQRFSAISQPGPRRRWRTVETSPSPPSETARPDTGNPAPPLALLPRHGPQSGEEPHRFGAPTSESGPVLWGP